MKIIVAALLVFLTWTSSATEEKKTIMCEDGHYSNGVLRGSNNTTVIECEGTRKDGPACQTKVALIPNAEGSITLVWKHCKTISACNKNAERFNSIECLEDSGKNARICVSCCETDNCNEDLMQIKDVENYKVPKEGKKIVDES